VGVAKWSLFSDASCAFRHLGSDPHQAPKPDIDQFEAIIRSDTYKVTAAQISTMDVQIGRIYNALQSADMLENCIISFTS
jgi:arylsulfatase A-like enzyme